MNKRKNSYYKRRNSYSGCYSGYNHQAVIKLASQIVKKLVGFQQNSFFQKREGILSEDLLKERYLLNSYQKMFLSLN
jgi:hypothetical protein